MWIAIFHPQCHATHRRTHRYTLFHAPTGGLWKLINFCYNWLFLFAWGKNWSYASRSYQTSRVSASMLVLITNNCIMNASLGSLFGRTWPTWVVRHATCARRSAISRKWFYERKHEITGSPECFGIIAIRSRSAHLAPGVGKCWISRKTGETTWCELFSFFWDFNHSEKNFNEPCEAQMTNIDRNPSPLPLPRLILIDLNSPINLERS